MTSPTESTTTTASPTSSPAEPGAYWGALIVVAVLSICVVIVVATAAALALRGRLSAVAFLGLVTTLLAALVPSPLTKLRSQVSVGQADQVGPNR